MAKKQGLEPISADERYAVESAILARLQTGADQIDGEIAALRIETYLARQPLDPRAPVLRTRLAAHRARSLARQDTPPSSGDRSTTITAALALLGSGTRTPRRSDYTQQIKLLEQDMQLLREALREQHGIVDAIVDQWTESTAQRLRADDDADAVAAFKAAQQLAAIHARRVARFASLAQAGGRPRPEMFPAPTLRASMVLGAESTHDSDLATCRRKLDDLKLI